MGRPRNNPDEIRSGRHAKDTLRIAISANRDVKAALVYAASISGITLTKMLIDGGIRFAQEHGILDENGNVRPEHVEGVKLVSEIIRSQEGN